MAEESNVWKATAIESAIRQGPSFVVLLLILYGIWASFDYAVKTAVPAHLKQIQDGYEKIQTSYDKNLDRVILSIESEKSNLKATQDGFRQAANDLRVAAEELSRSNRDDKGGRNAAN